MLLCGITKLMAHHSNPRDFLSEDDGQNSDPALQLQRQHLLSIPAQRSVSGRKQFPGWETHEGKRIGPRADEKLDAGADMRFESGLNPATMMPKPSAAMLILALVLGMLILLGICLLLFCGFMRPMPRHVPPTNTQLNIPPGSPF